MPVDQSNYSINAIVYYYYAPAYQNNGGATVNLEISYYHRLRLCVYWISMH